MQQKSLSAVASNNFGIAGLSSGEVARARQKYGDNRLAYHKSNGFLDALKALAGEPMVILLLVASAIYLISGKTGDAVFLAVAIVLVSAISLYQDKKSRDALEKLKDYNQPVCKVIRDGRIIEINTGDLVKGDSIVAEEGTLIAADGVIVHSNDFAVNESLLTGESLPVYKDRSQSDNLIYRGTTVFSGLAIAEVTAIGNETRIGKIGKSLESIKEEKTPLEKQIGNFVKKMVLAGIVVFIIVWGINYTHSRNLLDSLLKALTLAMSILPEEIPVALTTFMALGAWRLMKMGIVVKQMKTVETLGSATVICVDKTGTITENRMTLAKLCAWPSKKVTDPGSGLGSDEKELVRTAMWASEPIPFDPMEIALHDAYERQATGDERPGYRMIHEYPLGGKPPMMTHLFENDKHVRIIAAKGAPEALMAVSDLTAAEKEQVMDIVKKMSQDGCRVLGVAETSFEGDGFPVEQQQFHFQFRGLVAFYDPPKKNIKSVLEGFYTAGIAVKIITGDNATTTTAIAKEIGFKGYEKSMTGDDLMRLPEDEIRAKAAGTNIFSRMFPDAKLKIINALKAGTEIVAMTGDGVNDGPALKAAHIGIAMGKKGTEIAKQAASLILLEDDLSKMLDAVAIGRKIYANLKKAIQYIISIHIPIILTVFIPLALGWVYPNIFSPVHVIFLELIMGPTCSIAYENEPMEKHIMRQKPRPFASTFFNWKELAISVMQGLAITAGTLAVYRYSVYQGFGEAHTRSMVFTTLITANVMLTLVNRSFYYSVVATLKYRNDMIFYIIILTIAITATLIFVKIAANFFSFEALNLSGLLICIFAGSLSVIWYEAVKWRNRVKSR
ncbi:cation-translocating P-type ATPase [Mucilaginibacter ginsenosidivorans]|uniref:Cation-translocating P-type ATPase n=1 Tax=Mucilaginibacter ginsenosidivorans TaxID=398053 RepID=A0A5B8UWX3_9SPHI|nr:cation-translocating P-type ATPase [Mucilaginibacter ginsenosidivorans]QEC63544.1 cation-translocating P-type ATPase [Mucilaginibacter ginsenosidivorans]